MPDDTETERIHSIQRQHGTAQKVHYAIFGPDLCNTLRPKQASILCWLCSAHCMLAACQEQCL